MAAPVDNKHHHRAEVGRNQDYRERMFAVAVAAKITAEPSYCPKCHAPPNCFTRYPHSLECVCGWTGYYPTVIEVDETPLEVPRTLEQKRRDAGYSRVNGMSTEQLQHHMEQARSARKKS